MAWSFLSMYPLVTGMQMMFDDLNPFIIYAFVLSSLIVLYLTYKPFVRAILGIKKNASSSTRKDEQSSAAASGSTGSRKKKSQ